MTGVFVLMILNIILNNILQLSCESSNKNAFLIDKLRHNIKYSFYETKELITIINYYMKLHLVN